MVIAFFLSPSEMRGGDRASAVGGVGGDWGVGEKMCAIVARTKRHTRPAVGGSRGKPKGFHLFLPLVGAICCYASNPTEKKVLSGSNQSERLRSQAPSAANLLARWTRAFRKRNRKVRT